MACTRNLVGLMVLACVTVLLGQRTDITANRTGAFSGTVYALEPAIDAALLLKEGQAAKLAQARGDKAAIDAALSGEQRDTVKKVETAATESAREVMVVLGPKLRQARGEDAQKLRAQANEETAKTFRGKLDALLSDAQKRALDQARGGGPARADGPARIIEPVRNPVPLRAEAAPAAKGFIVNVNTRQLLRVKQSEDQTVITASGQKIALKASDVLQVQNAPKAALRDPGAIARPPRQPVAIAKPATFEVRLLATAADKSADGKEWSLKLSSGAAAKLPASDVAAVAPITPVDPAERPKDAMFRTPAAQLIARLKLTPQLDAPPEASVTAGGGAAWVPLAGSNLELITGTRVTIKGQPATDVTATLTPVKGSGRRLKVVAEAGAATGDYVIAFLAGKTELRTSLKLRVEPRFTFEELKLVAVPVLDRLRPSADKTEVTFYSVWRENNHRWTKTVHEAWEEFIATGTHLEKADLGISGQGKVRVRIIDSSANQVLASQTVDIAAGNKTSLVFDPPVALAPGKVYTFDLKHDAGNGTFTVSGSDRVSDFPWSSARTKATATQASINNDADLNLVLKGSYVNMPAVLKNPSKPSKKALVILLENGGVTLENVEELNDLVPKITFASCGNFRFELKEGQSILDKVGEALSLGVHCMNPDNWTFRELSFEDWWQPVSDHIAETISNSVSDAFLFSKPRKYDKVVRLQDGNFKPQKVLETLQTLSSEYEVDIHVLCHGGNNVFIGDNDSAFNMSTFFLPLKQKMVTGQIPLHLRAVYQMNCVSGTMVDEWLAIGADVVNGTSGTKNNFMPTQYHHFLGYWLEGKTFEVSIDKSFDDAKLYFNVIYAADSSKVSDSKQTVHGNGSLTLP